MTPVKTFLKRWVLAGSRLALVGGVLLGSNACGSPQGLMRSQGQKTVHPLDETTEAPPSRERSAPNPPIAAWREQAAHEQGLVEALKRALDPARVRRLRVGLAHQLGYRDRIPLSSSDLNRPPLCRFEVPIDRPLADGEDPAVSSNGYCSWSRTPTGCPCAVMPSRWVATTMQPASCFASITWPTSTSGPLPARRT